MKSHTICFMLLREAWELNQFAIAFEEKGIFLISYAEIFLFFHMFLILLQNIK